MAAKEAMSRKAINPPGSPLPLIRLDRETFLWNPHHKQVKRSVPTCAKESFPQFGHECNIEGVPFTSSMFIFSERGLYRLILIWHSLLISGHIK